MVKILVCGSVNVDVIAQSNEPDTNVRKSGHVQLCFGGMGHNMAINMTELGDDIGFLGALNDGTISELAIDNLENKGITCHIKRQDSLDDSLFVANFHKGQLVSATSTHAMAEAVFERDELRPIFQKYEHIVASTTFSAETLTNMSAIAKEQEKAFFVSVGSEAQAHKLTNLPYITAAFMNKREAAILVKLLDVSSTQDAATYMDTPMVVSIGKHSFLHAQPNKDAVKYPFEEFPVMGTTLGVGEMAVTNLIRSFIHTHHFDFNAARAGIDRILSVNHGHLGASHTLKLSLQREAKKAEADTLTGTLNRRGMHKFIERRAKQTGKISTLLIDIDHFKKINDSHGHDVGDVVLQQVSAQLKRFVRASDGLCRWGGEEFLVMLPDIGTTSASILAERIRKKIASTTIPELNRNITVSIGVAERNKDESTAILIKHADIALYEAKTSGRDKVMVYKEGSQQPGSSSEIPQQVEISENPNLTPVTH